MIGLRQPIVRVAPVAMITAIIISIIAFDTTGSAVGESTKAGVIDGLRIIWLIWAAFTMLILMQATGAIDKIKETIAKLTSDRRVHIILITVMLVAFLEGAAGGGTPAAIAAPFLVGLGFPPVTAAASLSNR